MNTKATGQNGPKSKIVNMKEEVVAQDMSKSLLAFAAHPIWKLDTKASKIKFVAKMEDSPLVGKLLTTSTGHGGLLYGTDTPAGRNPIGHIHCFGDSDENDAMFVDLSCMARFPVVDDFPQAETLIPLLEQSLGCPVVFQFQRLNITSRDTLLYSVFDSDRGGITASVMSFKNKQRKIQAVTSLLLMPGIRKGDSAEELLWAKVGKQASTYGVDGIMKTGSNGSK